jgi:hypothetical protein
MESAASAPSRKNQCPNCVHVPLLNGITSVIEEILWRVKHETLDK